MSAAELLSQVRLLPVVVIEDAAHAVPLAQALSRAGIGAIEVTLRTDAAMDAVAAIAQADVDILLGVGSIRRPEQLEACAEAGAAFAVSPGATDRLLSNPALPLVPGAASASECMRLLDAGYTLQKWFPAEQLGGAATIKAVSAPLPEVRFCPTGGVNPNNLADYFGLPAVSTVGGSWFVDQSALQAGNFEAVEQAAWMALQLADTAAS